MEEPAVASLQAQAEPLAALSISHLSPSTRLKLADDQLSVNAYPTESGGVIYVNFGRRWTEDFTVTISKRNEALFIAAGLAPKVLQGRRVRIRGVVEERGGPWIEVIRPEQIEMLDGN